MDIVSKIEIKHFRSFDGGSGRPQVKVEELVDLNVFSGANDSGKSNVLRALNLFFNGEISPGVKFNKDRDFSKIVANRFDQAIISKRKEEDSRVKRIKETVGIDEKRRDLRRSDEIVTIKLYFNNREKQRGLPTSFWISKVYSKRNNFSGEYRYQSDLNKAQTTTFLNSFRFEYVPAIKDRQYFNYLFGKLQEYLFEKSDKSKKNKFAESSDKFNDILKAETQNLFNKFMESSGVEASFHIPSTLVDFFRTLSVRTENKISLFDRGDGVQARFIPEILNEICQGQGRNVIWAFEEPENSYEYKNIRKLRDEFQFTYSRDYQIFLTTHTKEFLSLKRKYVNAEIKILDSSISSRKKEERLQRLSRVNRSSDISIHRVWKTDKQTSLVTRYDEENGTWDDICDDLGIIQEARLVDELQLQIDNQVKEIRSANLTLNQQQTIYKSIQDDYRKCLNKLQNAEGRIEEFTKPILVVEDKLDDIYRIAFLKVKEISFTKETLQEVFKANCPFVIRRAEGAGSVRGLLSMNNTDGYEDKKIIGLFDYDKEGCENFYFLKRGNDWADEILGDKKTGYYKKRSNHNHFFGLLLPIADRLDSITSEIKNGVFESCVEIENLISEDKLVELECVDEKTVFDKTYYKVKDQIKKKSFEKFGALDSSHFKDFKPLFNKIDELFSA